LMYISIYKILFFFFSFFILFSGLMVVTSWDSNPIQAVLFMILCFVNASGLLLVLGVEYLGLIFTMIYVGAIAILFLFVVMMLNIKIYKSRDYFQLYPISFIVTFMFITPLFLSIKEYKAPFLKQLYFDKIDFINYIDNLSILNSLGQYMYSYGVYYFLISGIILLIAMIGAICLTQNKIN
jgi:NADH-quinone oxidoreductase subunit J